MYVELSDVLAMHYILLDVFLTVHHESTTNYQLDVMIIIYS